MSQGSMALILHLFLCIANINIHVIYTCSSLRYSRSARCTIVVHSDSLLSTSTQLARAPRLDIPLACELTSQAQSGQIPCDRQGSNHTSPRHILAYSGALERWIDSKKEAQSPGLDTSLPLSERRFGRTLDGFGTSTTLSPLLVITVLYLGIFVASERPGQ